MNFGDGGVGSRRISERPLGEQGTVVTCNRDQETCREREAGGFKAYFGININGKSCCHSWEH